MQTENHHRDSEANRAVRPGIDIDVLLTSLGVAEGSQASDGVNGWTTLTVKELQVLMGHEAHRSGHVAGSEDAPPEAFVEAISNDE